MIAFLDTLSGLAKWLAGLSLQLIRKYTRGVLKQHILWKERVEIIIRPI